jgi:hypothetical protein
MGIYNSYSNCAEKINTAAEDAENKPERVPSLSLSEVRIEADEDVQWQDAGDTIETIANDAVHGPAVRA